MNALVTEAARRGLNVHFHAVGDLGVKASLDAFEAVRSRAVPQSTPPFSLTHAGFVDPQDIPRFAQLHVNAVLQLLWATNAADRACPACRSMRWRLRRRNARCGLRSQGASRLIGTFNRLRS